MSGACQTDFALERNELHVSHSIFAYIDLLF